MSRRIEVIIDELVLHGFPAADGPAVGAALSRELETLLQGADVAALAGLGSRDALRSPELTLAPGARPAAVGARVAHAVRAGLETKGQGGGK